MKGEGSKVSVWVYVGRGQRGMSLKFIPTTVLSLGLKSERLERALRFVPEYRAKADKGSEPAEYS